MTNEQAHSALGFRVARDLLGAGDDPTLVEIGPLASNYYSFTFSVTVNTANGPRSVFVKIPKVDMRGIEASIFPITVEDQRMALEEASSLGRLGEAWRTDDLDVSWVKVRGAVPEFNAIVTDRVYAEEALSIFRRCDLRRRLGFRKDAQRLRRSMARLGAALGRFHQRDARPAVFRLSEALPKYESYCRKITESTGSAWPGRICRDLRSLGDLRLAGIEACTLKGIDIRNVLMDERDRLYLLDPGKAKYTFREADLARFVMTYRILYWGSRLLLLVGEPDPSAEAAFLDAYYSNSEPPCPRMLGLFLLKEQLKHWYTALDSLQRLTWAPAKKRFVARVYVNPFYTRQVAAQLQLLMERQ